MAYPLALKRGRPRDPVVHESILAAARDVLIGRGYPNLTIEAVAARAGVGKASIYRRWTSKAALVFEVLFARTRHRPLPDTGAIGSDLRIAVGWGVEEFASPEFRAAAPGLVAEVRHDAGMCSLVREGEYARFRRLIERGIERGELRSDLDVNVVMDVLVGALFFRAALIGHPLDSRLVDDLVRLVLDGARS
jgi:AcrR family transcriptional regulator